MSLYSYKYTAIAVFITVLMFVPVLNAGAAGIGYRASVRNAEGKAVANAAVRLTIDIMESPGGMTEPVYSEDHFTSTDSEGMFYIMIGDGIPGKGDFGSIDWSVPLYAKVHSVADGNGHDDIGVFSLSGVPKTLSAGTTGKLVRSSPDGSRWELTVNNAGDISWKKTGDSPDDEYDKAKWPEELYLVGNITNDWDPSASVKFTKLSNGRFVVRSRLKQGDIIKFIKVQSWNGDLDWSGTSGKAGDKAPLKEWGDTPPFEGAEDTYMILVDFKNFTLRIYN